MPAHVFDPKNPRHVAAAEYLKERAGGVERVAELLWHSVGRIWLKHDERFLTHDFARIGMIAHIADWLKVSVKAIAYIHNLQVLDKQARREL